MKKKVIVTRRWPEAVEKQLAQDYDAIFNTADKPMCVADFQDALSTADALLPTVTDKLGADVFDIPNIKTKIIANYGVGFSHIDLIEAKKVALW